MSFSNPTAKNPAVRFMSWRGGVEGGGRLAWYDKKLEKELVAKLPFNFIVLDELTMITGYSKKERSGFWSNEIRNLKNDELVVRTKGGIVANGLYANISAEIKAKGAKYAKSAYIMFRDDTGEFAIGNINISGSALNAWIEFQKKFNTEKCAVIITKTPKKEKNGSNEYFTPVFEGQNVSPESAREATKLDHELQAYLNTYLSRRPELDTNDAEIVEDVDEEIEIEDTDVVIDEPANTDGTVNETTDSEREPEPIKLSEIPF